MVTDTSKCQKTSKMTCRMRFYENDGMLLEDFEDNETYGSYTKHTSIETPTSPNFT